MRYFIDLETISTADLTKIGSINYAKHKDTFISVFGFKREGEATRVLTHPELTPSLASKEDIEAFRTFLNECQTIVAHNSSFEEVVIKYKLNEFAKLFNLEYDGKKFKYIDTMTLAMIFRSPAKLALACEFFELDTQKSSSGTSIMKKVCVSQEKTPPRIKTTTLRIPTVFKQIGGLWVRTGKELYELMIDYCRKDVEACAGLFNKLNSKQQVAELGEFLPHTVKGIELTESMNNRGVSLDMNYVEKLNMAKDTIFNKLDELCIKHLGAPTGQSRAKIMKHLKEKGYKIDGLGFGDIQKALMDESNDKEISRILELYNKYNKISLNKITKAAQSNVDGVIYNMFKFCGARATGRWSSFGLQLQNLPRPVIGLSEVEAFMDNLDEQAALDNPDKVVSAIRAMVVPKKDHKFFIADLSQIELRVALNSVGYSDKVKAMSEGHDLYIEMAEKLYKKKVEKGSEERRVGKEVMLACQYGLGAGAFVNRMELQYGIKLSVPKAKHFINIYRETYPAITAQWDKYNRLVQKHLLNGTPLKVKLATGRIMNYGILKMRPIRGDGSFREVAHYFDGQTWKSLWGGNVFQHKIQAEARDIMLIKMNDIYTKGAKVVMTIHDEVVVEVKNDANLEALTKLWNDAGKEDIEKFFSGITLDSECVLKGRYYDH